MASQAGGLLVFALQSEAGPFSVLKLRVNLAERQVVVALLTVLLAFHLEHAVVRVVMALMA